MIIVSFIIIAWILSWFKFEQIFIQAFKELFNKEISTASYYFIFACLGAIGDIVALLNGSYFDKI